LSPSLSRTAAAAADASKFSSAAATEAVVAVVVVAVAEASSLLAAVVVASPRAPVATEARKAAASAAESDPAGDERSLRGASVAVLMLSFGVFVLLKRVSVYAALQRDREREADGGKAFRSGEKEMEEGERGEREREREGAKEDVESPFVRLVVRWRRQAGRSSLSLFLSFSLSLSLFPALFPRSALPRSEEDPSTTTATHQRAA